MRLVMSKRYLNSRKLVALIFVLVVLMLAGCGEMIDKSDIFMLPYRELSGDIEVRTLPQEAIPLDTKGDRVVNLEYQYSFQANKLWLVGDPLDERILVYGQNKWKSGVKTSETTAIGYLEVLKDGRFEYSCELVDFSDNAGINQGETVSDPCIGLSNDRMWANRIAVALPYDDPGTYRVHLYFRELIAGNSDDNPLKNASTSDRLYDVWFDFFIPDIQSTLVLTDVVSFESIHSDSDKTVLNVMVTSNRSMGKPDIEIGEIELWSSDRWVSSDDIGHEVVSVLSGIESDPYYSHELNRRSSEYTIDLSNSKTSDMRISLSVKVADGKKFSCKLVVRRG